MNNEVIIKDTHRALRYEDGVLKQVLGAGRYKVRPKFALFRKKPKVELVVVDVRERELTIKGQEILTADKVALRVSVIVQFRVTDAQAAVHAVQNYEERLYSDVQLAAIDATSGATHPINSTRRLQPNRLTTGGAVTSLSRSLLPAKRCPDGVSSARQQCPASRPRFRPETSHRQRSSYPQPVGTF